MSEDNMKESKVGRRDRRRFWMMVLRDTLRQEGFINFRSSG